MLLVLLAPASGIFPAIAGNAHVNVEPWADKTLKVTNGLEVWLDAAAQKSARKALKRPEINNGGQLTRWFDGSGHARHLVQADVKSKPVFVSETGYSAVRFDGKQQHLALTGLTSRFPNLTIFLVAAPFSNPGGFQGFMAINETGKNDYTSGLTIDQSWLASPRLQSINVEGAGFGGAANLLKDAQDFGTVQSICVTSAVGPGGVKLYLDGKFQGQRNRSESVLAMDQLTVGARFYTNGSAPEARGFFDGDVAEVLIYDRVLSDDERAEVERYLAAKYGKHRKIAVPRRPTGGTPLVSVPNPPPVQMFVSGFAVRQLPIDLPNINNLKYRPDGKLIALAYDGDVYLLSDTDGDGVEDKAAHFWQSEGKLQAPIGMALTPPGYKHGNGVIVAAKGKISLIVDADGDDKADKEIIVAEGWKQLPHGVDALGVAIDREGSIYFGLGTTNFTNGYLVEKDGRARYDLKSERGTICRVAPDFSKREIIATGIRFPVAMAFNRHGDLFATDQEGATWLPNGNPLDELLHIEKGRHYGFPPRHPKHLPNVIDEPSVFDYSPQHQSVCGLNFNESILPSPLGGEGPGVRGKGETFGPPSWSGDAIVSGYSRGKLYRTKLVKTPSGYVGQSRQFASLNMMSVDACVAPGGDLVVAAHSGLPDWGTGPKGKGKLFKIAYRDRDLPQPLALWPATPQELRITFDRPLSPEQLQRLAKKITITYGENVRAGDRFEVHRPPYAIVQQQMNSLRQELAVLGVQAADERRTLVIATAPHSLAVHYAITLPGLSGSEKAKGELAQHDAIDLAYDLSGAAVQWQSLDGKATWVGWLPHIDLTVAKELTAGSFDHDRFWKLIEQPGTLVMQSKLDLWQMLRPAVQPGSKLDYSYSPETIFLTLNGGNVIEAKSPGLTAESAANGSPRSRTQLRVRPQEGKPIPVEIKLATGPSLSSLHVSYATEEDSRPRALPLHRLLLPWATREPPKEAAAVARVIPELNGGNWVRGRAVFFSEEAQCAKCHVVQGQGGRIGPDLSNLIHRDYASVLRDIREPSAAINPDHLAYAIALKDGRTLTGTLRTEPGGRTVIGDLKGIETAIAHSEIEAVTPASSSTMPEGLDKALGAEKLRDLLTFLLTEPLQPAALERKDAPPPRSRAEVDAVLKTATPSPSPLKRVHIVLAAGPKDHGPGEHDYPLWQRRWVNLLSTAENVSVSEANGWPTPKQWETAEVVVFYSANPAWSADKVKEMDAYLNRGGGLVYLHYAVDGRKAVEPLAERIGLAWRGGFSKFRHGALDLTFSDSSHPITRGFQKVRFVDESYWNLVGDTSNVNVLATGVEEGQPRPLLWTHEKGKGRVFVSILGHFNWTFDDPLFRILILRGMAWSANQPPDRWSHLAVVGARIQN